MAKVVHPQQNLIRATKEEAADKNPPPLIIVYQDWYTNALPVVRQLIPERYAELQEQYKVEKRKNITTETYGISDYLLGLRVTKTGQRGNTEDVMQRIGSQQQMRWTN